LFFGLVGKSLLLAGFQRWLSIGAGVVMLILLITSRKGANHAGWRAAALIKTTFRSFLQKRSYGAVFALGAANGLLPCGLVYLAGTAAAAAGEPAGASIYMIVFGFGTFPMMLGLGIFGPAMAKALQRFRLGVLVPVAVSLVALSLILRGLALGIPYLSPSVADGHVECSACAD
jgi:sulfite exporter TauE/SafE